MFLITQKNMSYVFYFLIYASISAALYHFLNINQTFAKFLPLLLFIIHGLYESSTAEKRKKHSMLNKEDAQKFLKLSYLSQIMHVAATSGLLLLVVFLHIDCVQTEKAFDYDKYVFLIILCCTVPFVLRHKLPTWLEKNK